MKNPRKFQAIIDEIKSLSSKQAYYKNQRKTERLIGERKMESRIARYEHSMNRDMLRHLFYAYDILRGKEPIRPKKGIKPIWTTRIEKMVKQYAPTNIKEVHE